jgi:hypothetical protein
MEKHIYMFVIAITTFNSITNTPPIIVCITTPYLLKILLNTTFKKLSNFNIIWGQDEYPKKISN